MKIEKAINLIKNNKQEYEKLLVENTNKGANAGIVEIIKTYDMAIAALEEKSNGGWIPISERLPECEEEVLILTERNKITTAMYEDGKMPQDDSIWNWYEVDFNYDEENGTYCVPEGWWEYRHFNPDDVYNNAIDERVIAWQPLPELYKE